MNWRLIILSFSYFVTLIQLFAQSTNETKDFYTKWGVRNHFGKIVVHSDDVENTSGSNPFSIELEWSKRKKDAKHWDLCRCYPTTGVIFGYQNYDNQILGHGLHLAYFIQYHFIQRARISPTIRATGGISYNSNPFHQHKNPSNNSYSLPINFSIQLAPTIDFRISDHVSLDIFYSFNHISNGGIRVPNKGINWNAIGASIYYIPNFTPFTNRSSDFKQQSDSKKWYLRLEIHGSGHSKDVDMKNQFYPVIGAEVIGGYKISNLNGLLAGFDWDFDYGRKEYAHQSNLNKTAHRIGHSVGHEFFLGDFRFSQKIGIYLLDELNLNDLIYHKWGISYLLKKKVLFGIELRAHRHIAEFIIGKVGYQF